MSIAHTWTTGTDGKRRDERGLLQYQSMVADGEITHFMAAVYHDGTRRPWAHIKLTDASPVSTEWGHWEFVPIHEFDGTMPH